MFWYFFESAASRDAALFGWIIWLYWISFVPLQHQWMNSLKTMKIKKLIDGYWRELTTAVFGAAVFCLWLFRLPHLMVAREQMQLFLWNTDYLTERLAEPGGLSRWLGEFIVQFFLNPVYGACWYAALFVAIQKLTWRLFQNHGDRFLLSLVPAVCFCYLWTNLNVPMTLTVGFLLILLLVNMLKPLKIKARLIGLLILVPVGYWLVGGDCYWESDKVGTHQEMEYDMLLRQQKWEAIVQLFQKTDISGETSTGTGDERAYMAIQNAVGLASWRLGRISQEELMRGLVFSNHALHGVSSAFIMSEVAFQVGMVNISQRAAFEAMEAIPDYSKSARSLHRLVETNIITGNYDVALKYIAILEETTFYRGWARKMKSLAQHPETIKDYPVYQRLKEIYDNGEDRFFY